MSFQQDSQWAILDPSSKQNAITNYKPDQSRHTYLDVPLPVQREQAKSKQKQIQYIPANIPKIAQITNKQKSTAPKTETETILESCLKGVEEIDNELMYYKDSIYAEKLKVLEEELLSIENGSHPVLIKKEQEAKQKYKEQLQRIEIAYEYEKSVLDTMIDEEIQSINYDVDRQIGFAQNILRSEIPNIHPHSFNKKRKDSSSDKEFFYKKIELKKKVSKLQSVHDRQSGSNNKNKPKDLSPPNELDIESDFLLVEKKIMERDKNH